MHKTLLVYQDATVNEQAAGELKGWGEQHGYAVKMRGEIATDESFKDALPEGAMLLVLPVLEEDCLGVKLTQVARLKQGPVVVLLAARELPEARYLCLAFRAGIDDVLVTEGGATQREVQLKRADRLLTERQAGMQAKGIETELQGLHDQCKQLQQRTAKWEERLLALSQTATRLASGELELAKEGPLLLIVASSSSQGQNAAEIARRLGFEPTVAGTAAQGLEYLKGKRPRVIVADGTLPDMDVEQFARAARKALGDHPVMIIAWSSNPELEGRLLTPKSAIDDFVLKSPGSEGVGYLSAALLGSLR